MVILVGIFSVYFNKKPESTYNWITYSINVPDSDNFTFQYPSSEYVKMRPDTLGRTLRLQNYDPNVFPRDLKNKYSLEFFIHTADHISCEKDIANGNIVTNSKGTSMLKGQTQPNEGAGFAGGGIAVCIDRPDYVLYIQGSDHTGDGIVEKIIDSIYYH